MSDFNFKSSGIIRRIDKMGRVVIPMEMRRHLGLENEKDCFMIFLDGENVILKKFAPDCIFCRSFDDLAELDGKFVCKNCLEKLNQNLIQQELY